MLAQSIPDPYRFGDRVDQIVARHARHRPLAPAIQQGNRVLTYQQLMTGAERVAGALHQRGVTAGDIVPVFLARSCELVVTLLGILRAGATYIAMDVRWPEARVADVVQRSAARLVVTDGSYRPAGVEAVPYAALTTEEPGPAPAVTADGTAAACVFYTSGSTGRPKGVLSPHRGIIRTLVGCPSIPLDETTVFLQAAPLPWDGFALELWAGLLNGGRCVLLDRDRAVLEPDALRAAISRGVNTLWLTSSLFNLLCDEVPELFGAIRLLLVGGERVSPAHVRRVLNRFPKLRVVNGYGPAESTIFTTTHPVRARDVAEDSGEIPIGRPVPRTGVRLLAPNGGVADGRFGEIAVSGDGLALGYLRDEAETSRRFVWIDGVRHYRTGDLAELDAEGILRFRGRSDRQVKINGVRVEPGEIDAVLTGHPRVAAAFTVRVEPQPGRPLLATLYTTRHGRPLDHAALRAFAAERLIAAMVPEVFCHRADLPRGTTGKADEQEAARVALAACPDQPATGTPDVPAGEVLDLVRAALGRPDLGPHDDLLAAGASSLDVLRLVARLARTGRRVTMAQVYQARTADGLRRHQPRRDRPEPVDGVGAGPLVAPLSYAQRRFWMAEQLGPGMADNVVQLGYLITGPVRPADLEAAVGDVVERHPALRTVCRWDDGMPVQEVIAGSPRVEWVEPPGDAAGSPIDEVASRMSAPWWRERFALDREPPARFRLVRVAPDRHLLFAHVHHIAFDGWSEIVFLTDLAAAYRARSAGEAWRPAGPAFPYARHSLWEASSVAGWREEDLPYWRRTLTGAGGPVLPLAGSAAREAALHETVVRVSPEQVERLHRRADRAGGPRVAALLAGVGRAIHRTFASADTVLGTTSAGRFTVESQYAVGYFVNPLAIPMADLGRPVTDLLGTAVAGTLGALDHARTPFDEIVRDLGPPRDRHPFFQVWVVLQWALEHPRLAPGVALRPLRLVPPATARELVVEAVPSAQAGWDVAVQWRRDGVDPGTAGVFAGNLGRALAELAGAG